MDNLGEQIMNLLRYSFFIDHDLQGAAKTLLDEIAARADGDGRDRQREFFSLVLGLVASNRFEMF